MMAIIAANKKRKPLIIYLLWETINIANNLLPKLKFVINFVI